MRLHLFWGGVYTIKLLIVEESRRNVLTLCFVLKVPGSAVLSLTSRAEHKTAASALLPCLLVLGNTVPLEQ